jgi:hypothetical protein
MPGWLWTIAWAIWLAAPAVVMGLARGREEFDADARRLEGGTIYQDVVWELKGEAERSLRRLLDLMMAAKPDQQKVIAEEIEAQQRNMDRIHRLLHFKARQ